MKIAKIKGIEIKLHLSTLLIIGLVAFYAADFYYSLAPAAPLIELIIVGLINGIIILFSILAHELTHSLVSQRYGLKVSEIELYVFGGVSKIEQEPATPKSEFVISIVGPISSIILGAIFLIIPYLIPIILPAFLNVTFLYSGITNLGLGIFNLIPAYPVDGGRVLRAILWAKRHDILSATKTASKIGSITAYGLMAYGFIEMIITMNFLSGLWLIIIASFINNQTRHAYIQTLQEMTLSKIRAREFLSVPRIEIPFNTLISEVIRNYFMVYRKAFFPVIQGDNIVGVIHIEDVKKIPIDQRSEYIVGYAMKPASQFPSVTENQSGKDILVKLMQVNVRPHLVAVIDSSQNKILGFIGEEELVSSLSFLSQPV